jgi:hypothetical protein
MLVWFILVVMIILRLLGQVRPQSRMHSKSLNQDSENTIEWQWDCNYMMIDIVILSSLRISLRKQWINSIYLQLVWKRAISRRNQLFNFRIRKDRIRLLVLTTIDEDSWGSNNNNTAQLLTQRKGLDKFEHTYEGSNCTCSRIRLVDGIRNQEPSRLRFMRLFLAHRPRRGRQLHREEAAVQLSMTDIAGIWTGPLRDSASNSSLLQ